MAWRLLAWAAGTACRFGDAAEANRRAIEHARRAGDVRQERRATAAYAASVSLGPTLVDEAIARCEMAIEAIGGDRQSEGIVLSVLADPLRDAGRVRPRALLSWRAVARCSRSSGSRWRRRGSGWRRRASSGSPETSSVPCASFGPPTTRWTRVGETYVLSTVAGFLAQTLLEQGALEEASVVCDRSRELTIEADIATQGLWRYVRGRILTRQGAYAEAEEIIARGARVPRADRRDRLPDRVQRRARRGPRRGGPRRGGAAGLRGGAAARRDERRRRDPQRRAPPPRGSRRRLGDDIGIYCHQRERPVRLRRWL